MPRKSSFDDAYELDSRGRRAPVGEDDEYEERRKKPSPHHHPRKVAEGQESFKCGHCRTFVGPTISGGKHRNHCPLCLYSRHVDRGRPGDRMEECRSLMEPIGLCWRRNEQLIVHRCLGCDALRVCRVAADDNMVVLDNLPDVPYPSQADSAENDLDPFSL